jgi:acetyl-CoA carboxylase biotin carboxylase subunit
VHADTREAAILKMRQALDEFKIEGVKTTLSLHRQIFEHPRFVSSDYSTRFIEEFLAERAAKQP